LVSVENGVEFVASETAFATRSSFSGFCKPLTGFPVVSPSCNLQILDRHDGCDKEFKQKREGSDDGRKTKGRKLTFGNKLGTYDPIIKWVNWINQKTFRFKYHCHTKYMEIESNLESLFDRSNLWDISQIWLANQILTVPPPKTSAKCYIPRLPNERMRTKHLFFHFIAHRHYGQLKNQMWLLQEGVLNYVHVF